ncbi:MAG: GAF domain-containing protein, partial [Chloroflexi bacterium]|nr:GAF domain-containing protein [Chloroflexota bacterium]
GRNAFEFVHPDDLERVKGLMGQMLQDSHARVSGIFRFQHKNGSWRWIEGTGTNLLGEPSVRAIVLNYRDITDRRQAEEQIQRRAEELLAVNALGRALAESLELSEIYARLYQAILGLLPDSSTVFVSLFDRARELLVCAYGVQDGEQLNVDELPPIPLEPPGVGSQSEAIHTRRPFIVNDLQARLRRVKVNVTVGHSGPFPQSGLYVPMLAKGEVIGVVMVQCPTLNRYSQSDADLLSVVANTAAVAIENARLFDDAERRLRQTQALNNIDRAIGGSTDLRFTLKTVLDEVTSQLQVDAGDILLLNPHTHTLEYGAGRGFHTQALQHTRLRLGEGYAGRAALERRFVSVPDLRQRTTDLLRSPYFVSEAFIAYYGVPLSAKGQVVGVLEIFHRAPLSPDREWLDFLEALAGQAALAIDNATLFEGLERSNVELALAYDATIEGWSRALDLRDKETEGHTQRVTNLTVRLARALGLSQAELVHIRRGALLHDIGKMGVPDGILLKAGALTDQEWAVMRRHPVYAYEMLSPIAYLRPALDIPYCHHEKWDGTGYPRGLKGDQIPLAALIFAVVDVWDALRSDRPYRVAWPEEKVREHIRQQSGTHFDPKVVEKFLQMELG